MFSTVAILAHRTDWADVIRRPGLESQAAALRLVRLVLTVAPQATGPRRRIRTNVGGHHAREIHEELGAFPGPDAL